MKSREMVQVITDLLIARHAGDVFVPECKNGSTWETYYSDQRLLKLDGWAMKKSWKNPCMTGYEIKVDRSDFLNDEKHL